MSARIPEQDVRDFLATLSASLTNVPQMFKAAQVVDQVLSGQWNGGSTGSKLGSTLGTSTSAIDSRIESVLASGTVYSGVVINGDVHVTADTDDVFDAIKKKLGREKYSRTGTKPRDLVSRHLLAGQG